MNHRPRWRYKFITGQTSAGWRYADSAGDLNVAAYAGDAHLQVERRTGNKYRLYGYMAPDGTWRKSTSLTLEQYLKEI